MKTRPANKAPDSHLDCPQHLTDRLFVKADDCKMNWTGPKNPGVIQYYRRAKPSYEMPPALPVTDSLLWFRSARGPAVFHLDSDSAYHHIDRWLVRAE
ncbi:hypothetical protein PCASD_13093 [Puccinia coronata f. sp. avenae]|uniref:Uncharacterized protein n=1 Tax=Puccinia coronata f. sp. avenae TaxID=200324 RepID=A0A2N5U8N1_9BASI|nr:hypothetical protein PCASD_13093 [Puccinia coronata f. sp. avenae]